MPTTSLECTHRPKCPDRVSRFACGQRTKTEDAVKRGMLTVKAGMKLLALYGVPMSPSTKVFRGEPEPGPEQRRLV